MNSLKQRGARKSLQREVAAKTREGVPYEVKRTCIRLCGGQVGRPIGDQGDDAGG